MSQDDKVVLIVSHTTRDLCYMVPALLANFKNSPITLQSWLMGFLIFLTTFFEIAVCHIYPCIMCAMYNMHLYFGLHLKKKRKKSRKQGKWVGKARVTKS